PPRRPRRLRLPTLPPPVPRARRIRLWLLPRLHRPRSTRPTRRSIACSSAQSPSKHPIRLFADGFCCEQRRAFARRFFLEADQGRTPGKAATEGLQQQHVAAPDAAIAHADIEGQG